MVSREDLRLGLGISKSLAGLDRDARIFRSVDRRRALGEEGAVDFFRLQLGTWRCVGGDCLLERREAALVLGKTRMTKEPIQSPATSETRGVFSARLRAAHR